MVREDLVSSAVSFLQDPSVASAPLEKRIAFLQSKNLTQEEVDLALARSGGANSTSPSPASAVAPSYAYRQPAQYGQQMYPPPGYWQPPPPELPRRDWRDWFIMATVVGGVSYGVYVTAKRYLIPLISPPTPPQLTADKSAVDASFERTQALLDQLATDTAALKAAEEARTQRLDGALAEIEAVLGRVKDAGRVRDMEARQLAEDVKALRSLVPEAIQRDKEVQDGRLRELGSELGGLKKLLGNRFGNATTAAAAPQQQAQGSQAVPTPASTALPAMNGTTASPGGLASTSTSTSVPAASSPALPTNFSSATSPSDANATSPGAQQQQERATNPYGRLTNGRAEIPAWQRAMMAGKKEGSSSGANATANAATVEEVRDEQGGVEASA
jgi:peroxin-14